MITATTPAAILGSLGRLDAWYFLAPGAAASRRIARAKAAGLDTVQVGGEDGLGRAWQPSRFKRAYAGRGESFIPYLAPHDAFQYLPDDSGRLSLNRTENLDRYRIRRGQLLQTCSGRNLGPSVIADAYLERFATSHDLIRIDIDDERMRHYTAAYLRSHTGQGMLRRDKSGSVIDHISVGHVEAQQVPLLDDDVIDRAADLIRQSFELIEEARLTLHDVITSYEASLPAIVRTAPAKAGWTVRGGQLGRLDAAFFDPWIAKIRQALLDAGGQPISAVADTMKLERYKRVYVGADYGTPFMSGSQILQLTPSKQQYMAERAVKDPDAHRVHTHWTVYMVDGRAEGGLGVPALVTSDRNGWMVTEHVGRIVPHAGTDPGWLWLAARTWHAQAQIKALASGSIVDTTYPRDMDTVILPPPCDVDGPAIVDAWEKFARARTLEHTATRLVDDILGEITGEEDTADGEVFGGGPGGAEDLVDEANSAV